MFFSFLDILVSTRKKNFPVLKNFFKNREERKEEEGRKEGSLSQWEALVGVWSIRGRVKSDYFSVCVSDRVLSCTGLGSLPGRPSMFPASSRWPVRGDLHHHPWEGEGNGSSVVASTSTLVWQGSHQLFNQFLFLNPLMQINDLRLGQTWLIHPIIPFLEGSYMGGMHPFQG